MAGLTAAQISQLLDDFDFDPWTGEIEALLSDEFTSIAIAEGRRQAAEYGWPFKANDPFMERHFTSYIGERITQLSATTMELVKEELHKVLEEGAGEAIQEQAERLATAVQGSAAFSPARSLMIARTERAVAENYGTLLVAKQNGIEKFEVSDGDQDDECAEADGQIWTLDECLAEPTAHPNCTRAFAPVLDDDVELDAEDEKAFREWLTKRLAPVA